MDADDSIDKEDGGFAAPIAGPPPATLSRRVLGSVAWLMALRVGERLLGIVRLVVLARLLLPDDFGLFGIALVALSIVTALSKTGFDEAIVNKASDIEKYLGTAQATHMVRGVLLAGLIYWSAPPVAAFFEEPSAEPLLRLLALNMVLIGWTNVSLVLLVKELAFRRFALVNAGGTVVDFGVSIGAAFMFRDAWALVYGVLAGNLARLLLSYIAVRPVWPRFRLQRFRELAGFGGWVWGTNVVHLALTEGDDVIVGRMLGAEALGIYRMAFVYAGLPATEITHVLSRATFPAYAKLQDDARALRVGYLRALKGTALIAAPLALGIAVMASSFVRLILEESWQPMILPLQVLAVWGLVRALGATTGTILQGVGRPQVVTRLVLIKLMFQLALIFPLTAWYGLAGTAIAVLLAAVINFPLAMNAVMRVIECSRWEYTRAWLWPVLASAAMAAAVLLLHAWAGPDFGLAVFVGSILAGALIYAGLIFGVGRALGYDAFDGMLSS